MRILRSSLVPALAVTASVLASSVCAVAAPQSGSAAPPPATANDPNVGVSRDKGWPRSFAKNGTTVSLQQPQVDSWKDHAHIVFRCAVEVELAGASQPQWGVITAEGDTAVDETKTDVAITNLKATSINFPSADPADAAALKAVVTDLLPSTPVIHIALQRVMAYMHSQPAPAGVAVNLQPPPIHYASTPTVLVIFMGQPQFQPVTGCNLMWAVNTNWVVLLDPATSQYYLLVGNGWLTTADVQNGPWTAASQLPAAFMNLPNDDQWKSVRANVPGQPLASPPTVIVSNQPAELIQTTGMPEYSPVQGTSLLYVSNPAQPVFWDARNATYYYLVAGRWFSAPNIEGPWAAASDSLPPEFAKIPVSSPMGFVLSSVPGTPEAKDAVLLAQVPHKAEIKVQGTTVDVTYQGDPKFEPIPGTQLKYAVNTAFQVIQVDSKYYCCSQAVWFVASSPKGPWAVATSVPQVIYTIPPTSPVYNCTYVQLYSTTPTTVVYGYTSGYSGAYVATTGALMFGAGVALGAVLANNSCCWYGYPPCCYSYGCAPYYHYGYCGYYSAGYAHYGPYGGAGWTAGYNPATGNYYRGGAVSGPGGARWGGQAYNPWTNTYAQHTGGTNGYKSWGNSYVQNGNWSAQAGHESDARGSVGYAAGSDGNWGEAAHSNATDSTVARTNNGVYAGHDGNVYKNTGDGWQKYDNGSWNDVQKPSGANASSMQHSTTTGLNSDAWSRNYGNSGSSGWGDDRSSSGSSGWGGGDHSWGGGSSWGGDHSSSWGGGGHSFGGGGGWGGRSFGGGGFGGGGFHGGGFRR